METLSVSCACEWQAFSQNWGKNILEMWGDYRLPISNMMIYYLVSFLCSSCWSLPPHLSRKEEIDDGICFLIWLLPHKYHVAKPANKELSIWIKNSHSIRNVAKKPGKLPTILKRENETRIHFLMNILFCTICTFSRFLSSMDFFRTETLGETVQNSHANKIPKAHSYWEPTISLC